VRFVLRQAFAVGIAVALAVPASAQTGRTGSRQSQAAVTTTDIQRLQDQLYDANNEVSRLRGRDQATADRLQAQLDDLRDDVIYLRVKLRREGSVNRTVYNDVRAGVESVRSEARSDAVRQGNSSWPTGGAGTSGSGGGYGTDQYPNRPAAPARRNEVPAGQEIDVVWRSS